MHQGSLLLLTHILTPPSLLPSCHHCSWCGCSMEESLDEFLASLTGHEMVSAIANDDEHSSPPQPTNPNPTRTPRTDSSTPVVPASNPTMASTPPSIAPVPGKQQGGPFPSPQPLRQQPNRAAWGQPASLHGGVTGILRGALRPLETAPSVVVVGAGAALPVPTALCMGGSGALAAPTNTKTLLAGTPSRHHTRSPHAAAHCRFGGVAAGTEAANAMPTHERANTAGVVAHGSADMSFPPSPRGPTNGLPAAVTCSRGPGSASSNGQSSAPHMLPVMVVEPSPGDRTTAAVSSKFAMGISLMQSLVLTRDMLVR